MITRQFNTSKKISIRRTTLSGVFAFALLSAASAMAGEVVLTNLNTPDTVPNRSEATRSRLVDSLPALPWKGRAGRNVITTDLGTPKRVSSIGLMLGKGLRARSIVIRTSNTGNSFSDVITLRRVRGQSGQTLDLRGFDATAQIFQVEVNTKRGRNKKQRRKNAPLLLELEVRELLGAGGSPTPTPSTTPTASPTASPTSSPTPSPTGTATPTPTPLTFDKTEAASLNSNGAQSAEDSEHVTISDDGNLVAFHTKVKDFLPGSSSNFSGVFVRNRQQGTSELISKTSVGAPAPAESAAISGDGRFVAFHSFSNSIVAGDSNGANRDVFVYDRQLAQSELVSISTAGVQTNGSCGDPAISGTGQFVLFVCFDTNLVAGDNNLYEDVFLRDRTAGTTVLVSRDSNNVNANDASFSPAISDDGRYVVWDSRATNLVANDNNATSDVFIRDMQTGVTSLLSVNMMGIQGNDESDTPHISGDGNFVVFQSFATNLVTGTANRNIFLHNRTTDENILVSRNLTGNAAAENFYASVSDDGRYVAFDSPAADLVNGDNNGFRDTFHYDSLTDTMTLVSKSTGGVLGDADSAGGMGSFKAISGDGKHVAYRTEAFNLFPNDNNNRIDVVVTDLK